MSVLIIAEAGVNHNGDPQTALALVDAAAAAGADVVKFQTFRAERLVTRHAPKAGYQQRTTPADEGQLAMLRRLELAPDVHRQLIARCRARGIEFLSTAFDEESVDLLVSLGVHRLKIPSGEITNLQYLRHVGRQGKPILLSTGMATLEEVREAMAALEGVGARRVDVTVLHCTTEYPAPPASVNLRAMQTIAAEIGVTVGYSDHTEGISVPIAAVALGASVIEKHFTLDRRLPGPDHAASLEPGELSAMVQAVRDIERALGDGIKHPTAAELANSAVARRSIVAARPIRRGELFTEVNIGAKRPGTGVSPMRWDEVIGSIASRDFEPDEEIVL